MIRILQQVIKFIQRKQQVLMVSFFAGLMLCANQTVKAQPITVGTDLGGNIHNFGEFMNQVLEWGIPALGVVAVIVLTYAGYLYMTSQGNQENIGTAKELIMGVVLGLLLLFCARILVQNIIGQPPV